VIQNVVKNAEIDIPHVMVDQEIENMVNEQKNQMHYQGIELEQYLGYINQTMDTFKEQLHEPAENRVRTQLVLEAIAKAEAVDATEDEITAEVERMAAQYGMKAEDLKARITPGEDSFVKESVINHKTVELLTASAVKIAPPAAEPENGPATDQENLAADVTPAAE